MSLVWTPSWRSCGVMAFLYVWVGMEIQYGADNDVLTLILRAKFRGTPL